MTIRGSVGAVLVHPVVSCGRISTAISWFAGMMHLFVNTGLLVCTVTVVSSGTVHFVCLFDRRERVFR